VGDHPGPPGIACAVRFISSFGDAALPLERLTQLVDEDGVGVVTPVSRSSATSAVIVRPPRLKLAEQRGS
jgi:hypothetical protein